MENEHRGQGQERCHTSSKSCSNQSSSSGTTGGAKAHPCRSLNWSRDKYFKTPLHYAVDLDGTALTELVLLDSRILGFIDERNDKGYTVLHMCADSGSSDACNNAELLLEYGANFDAENRAGRTALELTTQDSVNPDRNRMVELLVLERGAKIKERIKNDASHREFPTIRLAVSG